MNLRKKVGIGIAVGLITFWSVVTYLAYRVFA